MSEDVVMTATVSAFFPQLDCEVADIHHSLTTSVSATASGPALGIVLNSTSCTATNSKSLCNPQTQICPPQAFVYQMYTLNGMLSSNDCQIPPDDAYIFFAIADVRYQQNSSSANLVSEEVSIASITGLICKPSYAVSPAHLELDPALTGTLHGANILIIDSSTNTTLPGMTNSNLTSIWYESLSAVGTIYQNQTDVDEALFHLMADANNHSPIEALLDSSVQTAAATAVFTAVMAQLAGEYLLVPANITLQGQVTRNEDRLHVRSLSVWLIVAGLGSLISAVVVVMLYRPDNAVPRDPDSIAAISTILASSDSIKSTLQWTGHLSDERLQQHLLTSFYSYQTAISSKESFLIENQGASDWPLPPSRLSKVLQTLVIPTPESRSCRPYPAGLPFVLVLLALPIVTIVLLEIIQQYSNKHNGLVNTGDAAASANALSDYLPAAFMMLLSVMFNSLDFTLMIFAPYSVLTGGNAPVLAEVS